METEIVKLSKVKANKANPRQIKDERFFKLVNSILVFPKMLHLRPIVVDVAKNGFVALGGNMRSLALAHISEMTMDELRQRLGSLRDFQKKSDEEQSKLSDHWQKWKVEPTAPIIKASDLSEDEKREFIIKDNVGFGEWDNDILANEWDIDDLDDWGLELIAPFVDDFSDKNEEINVDSFDDKITLKLSFTKTQYDFIIEKLNDIDSDKEKALLELLGYE